MGNFRHGFQESRHGFRESRHGFHENDYCICLRCGERVPHERGIPCQEMRCPKCKAALVRENSYHHQLFLSKQNKKED